MKKLIVFDMDGTLADTSPGILNSHRYAHAQMGRPQPETAVLCSVIGGPLLQTYENRFGFSEEEARKALVHYRRYYAQQGLLEAELYPGMEQTLKALKVGGYQLAVATLKAEAFVETMLRHMGVASYFDAIYGMDPEDSRTKTQLIRMCMAAVGATPEETVMVGSTRLRLIDTAGIRETDDRIEAMGVDRSKAAVENADLVIFVCDGSQPLTEEDRLVIEICADQENAIALINKSDLGSKVVPSDLPFIYVIPVSAETGEGLDQLADAVDTIFAGEMPCDGSILTNARQYDAIRRAYDAILRSLQGLKLGLTPDAVLTDVEEAMAAMGEVTGATVREDITARIFERFCVGK